MPLAEGNYYEDFKVGTGFTTLGRTITETDIVNFMGISGIFEELYQNVPYVMTKSVFKGRVVPGPCTFIISEGLVVQSGLFHHTGMALLEIQRVTYPRPTFANDTLWVDVTCVGKRESNSKPDRGILTFTEQVRNQKGELVADMVKVRMIRRRVPE